MSMLFRAGYSCFQDIQILLKWASFIPLIDEYQIKKKVDIQIVYTDFVP